MRYASQYDFSNAIWTVYNIVIFCAILQNSISMLKSNHFSSAKYQYIPKQDYI